MGQNYIKFIEFYAQNLALMNDERKIQVKWMDFFESYTISESNLIQNIQKFGATLGPSIGIFHYNELEKVREKQRGIIRINCIDCLDRSNNTMACISGVIFSEMLMKIELSSLNTIIDPSIPTVKNQLLSIVFEMFGRNGDELAKQYAGSEAFHKAQLYEVDGNWKTVKQNITFIAVKRYLNNILNDFEKQKSYNLFLGTFIPKNDDEKLDLWNIMDTDKLQEIPCECVMTEVKKKIFPSVKYYEYLLFKSYDCRQNMFPVQIPIVIETDKSIITKKGTMLERKEPSTQEFKPSNVSSLINPPHNFNFIERF